MDFSKLQKIAFDVSENGTDTTLAALPSIVLEAFIPGYSFISKLILNRFGFDIAIVVSASLLIFALIKAFRFIGSQIEEGFYQYFVSSVHIDDYDDLYYNIMSWVAEQRVSKKARSLKAKTRYVATFDADEDEDDEEEDAINEMGIFNFGSWASKIPPQYAPYFGEHRFWYKRRLYFFDRNRRQRTWGRDDESIKLTCIGRSTTPIKELLKDIKHWSMNKEKSMTIIRRPAAKDTKDSSTSWERVSVRPSRPMNTVSLDRAQKARIVADINEYLHPASPRWYAARGIPYRRGYLFHGPPGTGKTSLSFALAGIFGLNIYSISLMEPTLTEGDLAKLFNSLPRRCIVLLEDIDTAGLLRTDEKEKSDDKRNDSGYSTDGENADKSENKEINASTLAKALKSVSSKEKKDDDSKKRISLSGLLNAIDGVSSHEGRVLIMTTNHPEKLDAALIRPGRVDLQVQFTLATRDQIRSIFIRMYTVAKNEVVRRGKAREVTNTVMQPTKENSDPSADDFWELIGPDPVFNVLEPEKLRQMAETFASRLPEEKFSPAEVQGFLLSRKKEPQRALDEVEKWKDAVLEAKEKKSKVVDVQ